MKSFIIVLYLRIEIRSSYKITVKSKYVFKRGKIENWSLNETNVNIALFSPHQATILHSCKSIGGFDCRQWILIAINQSRSSLINVIVVALR